MAVSTVANQIRNDEIEIGFAVGFENMTASPDKGGQNWSEEVLAHPAGKDATMVRSLLSCTAACHLLPS